MTNHIKILGSSSKGNGYVLEIGGEILLIECGCKWEDALKACDYNILKIQGCLVTHEHNDHARYIEEYANKSFKVLATSAVFDAKQLIGRNCKNAEIGKGYKLGGFMVQAIKAYHDVPTVAWIVYHKAYGRIVFATDTYTFPYRIPNVKTWMIEANYADDILSQRVDEGSVSWTQRQRLMTTHMEIGNTIKVLQRNYDKRDQSPHPIDVILIHLSDGNSDAERFKRDVETMTRLHTVIANNGDDYELDLI